MKTFTVHQLVFSNELYKYLNEHGHTECAKKFPEWEAYLATSCDKWKDNYKNLYTPVASIQAEDLEGVFEASNTCKEEYITRLNGTMRSVSVGDIIVDENNRTHLVAQVGFIEVGN